MTSEIDVTHSHPKLDVTGFRDRFWDAHILGMEFSNFQFCEASLHDEDDKIAKVLPLLRSPQIKCCLVYPFLTIVFSFRPNLYRGDTRPDGLYQLPVAIGSIQRPPPQTNPPPRRHPSRAFNLGEASVAHDRQTLTSEGTLH